MYEVWDWEVYGYPVGSYEKITSFKGKVFPVPRHPFLKYFIQSKLKKNEIFIRTESIMTSEIEHQKFHGILL